MISISVVILTKNEAHHIGRCLRALKGLSDDIHVLDSGSTDNTVELAQQHGARVSHVTWQGYSETKNSGNLNAKHDWILSVDADEEINEELHHAIQQLCQSDPPANVAFELKRVMVYAGKVLRFGSVSNEYRTRIFNRQNAYWNQQTVHEDITGKERIEVKRLPGFMWHHSFDSTTEHKEKLAHYAQLSARQMLQAGYKPGWVKYNLSAPFHFIKNFVFKGGFLDGKSGYQFACNEMWYVQQKYRLLKQYLQDTKRSTEHIQ
jgi:glycosyltransferase involved in cell wall biosynthesis